MRRLGLDDVLSAGAEIDVRAAVQTGKQGKTGQQGKRRKKSLLERHIAGTKAASKRDRLRALEHGSDTPAILFESRRLGIDAIPAIVLADLYSFWLSRCGPRTLPSYDEMNPLGISWALSRIAVVEVERSPLAFRVRMDASRQVAARGQDLTGATVADLQPASMAKLLEAHYEEAVLDGAPSLRSIDISRDVTEFTCTSLALPLSNGGSDVDMLVTCLVGAEPLWRMLTPNLIDKGP